MFIGTDLGCLFATSCTHRGRMGVSKGLIRAPGIHPKSSLGLNICNVMVSCPLRPHGHSYACNTRLRYLVHREGTLQWPPCYHLTYRNNIQWNFIRISNISIDGNVFQNTICKSEEQVPVKQQRQHTISSLFLSRPNPQCVWMVWLYSIFQNMRTVCTR